MTLAVDVTKLILQNRDYSFKISQVNTEDGILQHMRIGTVTLGNGHDRAITMVLMR